MATLSKESKIQLKKALKKKIELFQNTKIKEIEGSVKQQIESDKNEIKDIGIIVCAFVNKNAPYDYIRTEPLFYFKNRNFDILLHDKGTIILIDVKDSLVSNALSKINGLKSYATDIINNIQIHNPLDNADISIIDYFEDLVKHKITNKEFVLASQKVHVQIVLARAEEAKYNFCLWKLLEKENKVFIFNERILGDKTSPFYAHQNSSLNDYLKELSKKGISSNDPLSFIFSSSCYLKSINISIPLFKKLNNEFTFLQWCLLFQTDIMNWHDEEKKIIFKNYIEYGIQCRFLKCIDDKKNIWQNKYSIVTRHAKTDALEKDILSKIIRSEVGKKIEENVLSIKKELEKELLAKEAEQRGDKLLTQFFDPKSKT